MAKIGKTISGGTLIQSKPKKSAQGQGKNSKFSARSNSHRSKKTRGQGK
jgi:hypothetical protein